MTNDTDCDGIERRRILRTVGAGTVGAAVPFGLGGSAVADESEEHYHNPTGPAQIRDPSVIRAEDGTFYVYGTSEGGDVIPFAKSDNLVDWTYVGAAMESEPDWRNEPEAGVWAPDINYYNGQYYLYYSYSTWGSQNNPGIGVATADTPEGPFTDQGPVFREREEEAIDVTNAIDSDLVIVDGNPFLVWGSWYGIYGVRLTDDGTDYIPQTVFHMAGNKKEGPMIVEENGYYYLFYSTGHCCQGSESTYEVEVGRSTDFFGPYYNQNGDDLRDLNQHHSGVSVMTGTDQFIGTGHNTAIQDDAGDWWMLYHAEATAELEEDILMVDRIRWDDNDWPVVGDDGTPSTQSPVPQIGDVGDGTDENGTDENGSDQDGTDGDGTDENGSDEDGGDENGTDGNESDEDGTGGDETDENGSDDDESDDGTADGSTGDPEDDGDDGIPGFGLVEPILAAGGAGYLLERRGTESEES